MHIYSIWEAEAGRSFLFELKTNLAYIIKQDSGQLALYSETVYKQTKKKLDIVFASNARGAARGWAVRKSDGIQKGQKETVNTEQGIWAHIGFLTAYLLVAAFSPLHVRRGERSCTLRHCQMCSIEEQSAPALVPGTRSCSSPQQSMVWTSVLQKLGRLQGTGLPAIKARGRCFAWGAAAQQHWNKGVLLSWTHGSP